MSATPSPASGLSDWVGPRKTTLLWITAGYLSFLLVFATGWALCPRIAPIASPVDRLLLGVQLAALPAGVLMLVLQGLWRIADTVGAENPFLGQESQAFQINQRVMTNTVEQTLIFVPMFVALSVRIDADHTWVLPLLMGIWCTGRLLFWAGYRIAPNWRAIGMDWTTGVSMVTAAWLASTWF